VLTEFSEFIDTDSSQVGELIVPQTDDKSLTGAFALFLDRLVADCFCMYGSFVRVCENSFWTEECWSDISTSYSFHFVIYQRGY